VLTDLAQLMANADGSGNLCALLCNSDLRAAMPTDGPIWFPYHDVSDISMYTQEEIDNSHDNVPMFNDLENHFT